MSDASGSVTATTPVAESRPSGRNLWGEPLVRLILVALGLFVAAVALTVPAAVHARGMSPFDEPTHADYAWQVAHGHVPARGSIIAAPIRREIACRGVARLPNDPLLKCGQTDPSPETFGAGGQDYNFGHPPLYYLLTGVFARVANAPFGGMHFITFARITGAIWLFAAMIVLYLALRRFGTRWQFALCAGLLLPCMPSLMYASATVTNDAAAALGGSVAILVAARVFVDRKLGWVLPGVLTALITATKVLNALPLLALAVLLLVLAWQTRRIDLQRARSYLYISVSSIVGAMIVYFGWSTFQKHRGVAHWVNPIQSVSSQPIKGLPFDELFGTSFSSSNVLSSAYLPPQLANNWSTVLVRLAGVLSIAAVGALLIRHDRWTPRFVLGAIAALGCLTYPWAVELQSYFGNHPHRYFPEVVPRYGLSFATVLVAAIAVAADDRNLRKNLFGFTAAALAIGAYTVFGVS